MPINVSVKLLQTSVRVVKNRYVGRSQGNARDKRGVTLPNGETLATTNLVDGGFDLLGKL